VYEGANQEARAGEQQHGEIDLCGEQAAAQTPLLAARGDAECCAF
jgi:hypothetical protein